MLYIFCICFLFVSQFSVYSAHDIDIEFRRIGFASYLTGLSKPCLNNTERCAETITDLGDSYKIPCPLVSAKGITADDFEPVAYGAFALATLMWCVPFTPSCGGYHLPRRILYLTGLASHIYMVVRTINTYASGLKEGAFEPPIPTISDVAEFIQDDCQCEKEERFYIREYSQYGRGSDIVPVVLSAGPIIPVAITAGACWLLLACNGGGGGDCRDCNRGLVGDDLRDRPHRSGNENSRAVHPEITSGSQTEDRHTQRFSSSRRDIEMVSYEFRPATRAAQASSPLALPPVPPVPLTVEESRRREKEINATRMNDAGWMLGSNCLVQFILSCIGCSEAFNQKAHECYDFVENPN